MTGGKAPGMAAEAIRMFRTRSRDSGTVAGGQLADVPDDRAPLVEIGRSDQQQSSLRVFRGDVVEHRLGDVSRHRPPERRRGGKRVLRQRREIASRFEHVLPGNRRIDLLQLRIVARPQERERRDERAGADAGHQLELGPRSRSGPADQKAGAERAILAATGYRQVVGRWERPLVTGLAERRQFSE